ncbi:MAG: lytic transglycosylase domain-containing protein [Acidobacteria bacterium]|nr:lytic transglycosylase domain-containing protein [Acidobacteriota bacterium]
MRRHRIRKGHSPSRVRAWAIATLAIGLIASSIVPGQAAENISGFVDSAGRVVFVNEPAESSATPKVHTSSKTGATGRKLLAKTSDSAKSSDSAAFAAEPAAVPDELIITEALGDPSTAPESSSQDIPTVPRGRDYIAELVSDAARRHQVDADLVHAIVRVESNYNPYAVSNRGARGLMQLIPATARRFGVMDSFDPRSNLDGGIRYLKYLMGMFKGDVRLSLAAYNAGEMAVTRNGGVPPYRETQNYIRKISELYSMSTVAAAAGVPPEPQIFKYVDDSGVIHFSNTDRP